MRAAARPIEPSKTAGVGRLRKFTVFIEWKLAANSEMSLEEDRSKLNEPLYLSEFGGALLSILLFRRNVSSIKKPRSFRTLICPDNCREHERKEV
jgi:hypothetical protein